MIPLLAIIPLIGAILIAFIPKSNERLIRSISIISVLFTSIISIDASLRYDIAKSGFQFTSIYPWLLEFGISYQTGLDGMGCILILLHSICSLSAVLVSSWIKERAKEYYIFFLVLISSIYGVFTALDLFFLYVFYEMAVIPMYPLITIWGSKNKEYGAMKLTLYITSGAVLALVGVLALYQATGLQTFDLVRIKEHLAANPLDERFQTWCAAVLIVGFGVIASLWPFHSWSPIGYAAAPAPVSMLHAGVLKKIGIFGILRLVVPLLPIGAQKWFPVVAVLAVINVLYGAWAAMAQKDLKFVIGFASVSHMGYALLGLSALNEIAMTGVIFFMFAHGVMAALCFALIGFIDHCAHTRNIADFGGLAKKMPFIATFFIMAALASSGLPGFANFVSEIVIFFGAWKTRFWPSVFAIFGIVVTATYMLRLIRNVFFGELNSKWNNLKDAETALSKLPYVLLMAALLIFGFWPKPLLELAASSAHSLAAPYEQIMKAIS